MLATRAVDDYSALCNLEGHYARTWDNADAAGWAALFTSDGVFEMVGLAGRPNRRFAGTTALEQFCRDIHKTVKGLHLIHTPAIDFDGDEARGRVHFEFRSRWSAIAGAVQLSDTVGFYDVHYVRTGDGWRMKTRIEQAIRQGSAVYYTIPESL